MKIEPGLIGEYEFTVTEELATTVAGTVPNGGVLATPRMIGMMERASMVAIWQGLPEGATCVGYEVNIKHVAAAPIGEVCVARAELVEVIAERKLRFTVQVTNGDRTIGTGTHERRIITADRLTRS